MFNFFPYIIKRAVHHRQLLLTLSLSLILATGLLANGPLLIDTVIQLGLRSALSDADPLMCNNLLHPARLISLNMNTKQSTSSLRT